MPEGDLSALLHLADVALYQAKRAGRNRVATYSPDFEPDKGPTPQTQGS
jgi:predicted signal transduction protein with EAL and GGDEF domain